MKIDSTSSVCSLLACGALAFATHAGAAGPPDFTVVFPAGLACQFELQIDGWDGSQHERDFLDDNGNVVRMISAGTGSALLFTNLSNGKTLSTKSNGSVTQRRYNADGSYVEADTGHTILILFPTDNPPGPTTTLIVGRLVFSVDTNFNFDVQSVSGRETAICAALS